MIIVERKIGEVDQVLQSLDLLDIVEGEIEPLEVHQVAKVLNFFNHIIIELKFL